MPTIAIHTDKLTKFFEQQQGLKNLNLKVEKAELFGLIGPDGSGKTTTMRLLTSIMNPTSGDAWIAGHHIVKEAEVVKEKIGYMSQKFGLYQELTVLENLKFYANIYEIPYKLQIEKIDKLLEFSRLTNFQHRLAGNLSGGMKQKLGLSCALIHTPEVLFLDEPTNGLDPISKKEFWELLHQLINEKVTIFISTSYLNEAEYCHRVGCLYQGELLSLGTPDEIKKMVQGVTLDFFTDKPREVLNLLQLHTNIPIRIFQDRIHIITKNPKQTLDEIFSLLAPAKLELLDKKMHPLSLEDAFILLIKER